MKIVLSSLQLGQYEVLGSWDNWQHPIEIEFDKKNNTSFFQLETDTVNNVSELLCVEFKLRNRKNKDEWILLPQFPTVMTKTWILNNLLIVKVETWIEEPEIIDDWISLRSVNSNILYS